MNNNEFLNTVFDLLAQNTIDPRHQMTHAEVTELIDCVDFDRQTICFKSKDGREFELRLVHTYAPTPAK